MSAPDAHSDLASAAQRRAHQTLSARKPLFFRQSKERSFSSAPLTCAGRFAKAAEKFIFSGNDQRDVHAVFIEVRLFQIHAVAAQIFAVIRVKENDRALKLPGLFQIIEHPADLYANKVAHRPVCGSNQAMVARGRCEDTARSKMRCGSVCIPDSAHTRWQSARWRLPDGQDSSCAQICFRSNVFSKNKKVFPF